MFLSYLFVHSFCCFCLLYSGFVIIAVHATLSATFTSNYCRLLIFFWFLLLFCVRYDFCFVFVQIAAIINMLFATET